MGRTGNHSTKPSAKGYGLLGGGEDPFSHLSDEEKRASLVSVANKLQADITALPIGSKERKELGRLYHAVEMEIRKIRPKKRGQYVHQLGRFFMDICKENMTRPQFDAILNEARDRQRADEMARKSKEKEV